MKYDQDKVDEMVLALLYLVTSDRQKGLGARAWKGFDLNTINRLFAKGWIKDPKVKATSFHLTEEGFLKSEQLFREHFGQANSKPVSG